MYAIMCGVKYRRRYSSPSLSNRRNAKHGLSLSAQTVLSGAVVVPTINHYFHMQDSLST